MYRGTITDVPEIEVGHAHDLKAGTGCTVIICRKGAVAGVDVRGAAPGTRETDLIRPGNLVVRVHGILLTGGSAFGLAAADGVMKYLEEQGVGFETSSVKVPIVAGAVLYDLEYGSAKVRPDAAMGYQACINASKDNSLQGSVGAGAGATVGKVIGMKGSMKSGIGTASIVLPGGIVVGAIAAVNAFGDVVDPNTGKILAGAVCPKTGQFLNTVDYILSNGGKYDFAGMNTTIGVVATNAALTKEQANRVAAIAHDGLARTIRPVHTMMDGDTLFTLSTGDIQGDMTMIGCAAVEVVSRAVVNAVSFQKL